jgi:hypothetical protein
MSVSNTSPIFILTVIVSQLSQNIPKNALFASIITIFYQDMLFAVQNKENGIFIDD